MMTLEKDKQEPSLAKQKQKKKGVSSSKKRKTLASGSVMAPKKSKESAAAEQLGSGSDKRGYYVDLTETNTVSWKQLNKKGAGARTKGESSKSKTEDGPPFSQQQDEPGALKGGGDSKLDTLKKKFGFTKSGENTRASANPLASVIQKIERMYGGAYASDSGEDSDEEGGSGAEEKGGEGSEGGSGGEGSGKDKTQKQKQKKKRNHKEDEYDLYDDFLDDSEILQYYDRQKSKTKHDGFFINKGKLETDGDAEDGDDHGGDRERSTNETDDFKPKKKKKVLKKKGQLVKGKSKASSSSKLGVAGGDQTKIKKKKKKGTIAGKLIADVNKVAIAPKNTKLKKLKDKQQQQILIEESENEDDVRMEIETETEMDLGAGGGGGGGGVDPLDSDVTESEGHEPARRPAPKPQRKITPKAVKQVEDVPKPKAPQKQQKQEAANNDLTIELSHTESDNANLNTNGNGVGSQDKMEEVQSPNVLKKSKGDKQESGGGLFNQEEEEALQHVNNLVEETLQDEVEAKKIKQRKIKRVPVNVRNIFPKLAKIWAKQSQPEKRRFMDCLMVKLEPFVEETSFRTKLNLLSAPYRLEQLRTTLGKENTIASAAAKKDDAQEPNPPKSTTATKV